MIDIEHVVKRYGDATVVDNVTLALAKGGITCLVGPNGAGKSTLLSIAGRLLGASAGIVRVDGFDVATTASDVLAERLSVLRQDNHVAMRLTVRELVAFGRYPYSKGRLTSDDVRHVDEAIAYLELDDLQDRYLDQLSGGQRQRAFIAMVLCQDTDYILLDEPLNNLDLRHARQMLRLLRRMADELGRTVIVVVHDINVASCHADRIVALRDGRVVAAGPPDEVVRTDTLEAVFGVDIPVHRIDGHRIALHFT